MEYEEFDCECKVENFSGVVKLYYTRVGRLVNITVDTNGRKLQWERNINIYFSDEIHEDLKKVFKEEVSLGISIDGQYIIEQKFIYIKSNLMEIINLNVGDGIGQFAVTFSCI